jgi:hypothetical protein
MEELIRTAIEEKISQPNGGQPKLQPQEEEKQNG